ncbi:hypothetical protein BUALT_Bualt07G0037400 [Buddleja alternifolia]|uniref:TF-B3 domain-containing protein n=1 Tax=Buddleja alternifolia TaxID=168488 RepID=A0AAV6XEM9_9LAMI|nr:hypothetical protein BUALT_Bualt07G0037400 [Buddleja alternifolia]
MGCRIGNRWRGNCFARRGCEKVCSYFVSKEVDPVVDVNVKESTSAHNVEKNKCFDDDCGFISSHKKKDATVTSGTTGSRVARKCMGRNMYKEDCDITSSRKGKKVSTEKLGSIFSMKWARRHGLKKTQDLELRVDGKPWNAKFYDRGNSVGITRGWKSFALENGLEEVVVNVEFK